MVFLLVDLINNKKLKGHKKYTNDARHVNIPVHVLITNPKAIQIFGFDQSLKRTLLN